MRRAKESAEQNYREAFERLKNGTPRLLPKGTPVSQNNVAREAGNDPSALKFDRFPLLIGEIQGYLKIHEAKEEQKAKRTKQQRENRLDLRGQLAAVTKQRDRLQSQRVGGHKFILEMMEEIEASRAAGDKGQSTVSPLHGRKR